MIFRPQRYRTFLGFLLGVIISVIALGTAFFFFQSNINEINQQKIQEIKEIAVEEYVQSHPVKLIYIATSDKKAGEVLTDQDLIPAEISQDLFPADAITEPSSVMGKVIRCDISKNTALTCSLLYDEKDYPDDMRLVEYTAITIPQKLEPLEYADIRIMFPNGLDYIVLSKKQIKDIQRQSAENPKNIIWFHSNEEEILRMASAIVDANLVEGTKLYAVPYVAPEIQGEAVRTYPSNPEVLDLILQNPNIVKKAVTELEIRNRAMFEDRINEDFQNFGRNKVFSDNTDSITISPVVNSEDIEVEAGTRLEDKL